MMKRILASFLTAALMALSGAAAAEEEAAYDLLFRDGTLDEIDRSSALVYQRQVINALRPDAADRDTGDIALSFRDADKPLAHLRFNKDEKHRNLGVFPASVGNPIIMYFYETVVRDMAESAGGSPFYIRNRVKDALVSLSEVEPGEASVDGEVLQTKVVRLQPFANDPNRAQMQGFGDLELRVTMSEDVPGWYVSLIAEAMPTAGSDTVYRSEMRFDHLDLDPDE